MSGDDQSLTQDELDAALLSSQFRVDDDPEFTVTGEMFDGRFPCIRIEGRVLGVAASELVDRVGRRFDTVKGDLVLELSACSFLSSVALGFIAVLADQRRSHHGRLLAVGASEQVIKMTGLLGFRDTILFCDSFESLHEKLA